MIGENKPKTRKYGTTGYRTPKSPAPKRISRIETYIKIKREKIDAEAAKVPVYSFIHLSVYH